MAFNIPSDWILQPDGTYHSKSGVYFRDLDLVEGRMPVQFSRIDGNLVFDRCRSLSSLEGCPNTVAGFLADDAVLLKSLKGGPTEVLTFSMRRCTRLQSVEHLPALIREELILSGCMSLKSLRGIEHSKIASSITLPVSINSHILGLFYTGVRFLNLSSPWSEIVNRNLLLGIKGMVPCALELSKAGYKNLAQL